MNTVNKGICILMLLCGVGTASMPLTAQAEENAISTRSQAVRSERSLSLTGGVSYEIGFIPLPSIRLGWNINPFVELEASFGTLTIIANRVCFGGRLYLIQAGLSPYAYARVGAFHWFNDQPDRSSVHLYLDGGAGLELALRGGFVAFAEGGVAWVSDYSKTLPLVSVSVGLGYRF